MRDYSPKRRTAVVFAGSGTSGAYHAGALKALDESGVKLDLVVGSGAGAVAAAFAAVSGGAGLYGKGGFWDGLRWGSLYTLRPVLQAALGILGFSLALVALPVALGLLGGLLVPLLPIVELAAPGWTGRFAAGIWPFLASWAGPYLAALAVPVLAISFLAAAFLGWLRLRGRLPEALEAVLDARRGRARLASGLWRVARGAALSSAPPDERELGKRYVTLLAENIGQPGFRELILRVADLDGGCALPFVLLADAQRVSFVAARSRGPRSRLDGIPRAVDLRAPGYGELMFDAVVTGLLAPLAAPVRRVAFPRGGPFGGQTRRLADATLAAGSGLAEALAAGAEQVILVSATPEAAALPLRRRGPLAVLDGVLATLERQGVERDTDEAERINRMVDTLGHRTEDGRRAWEDPASGRLYRDFTLYVIRPQRRTLAPLELDGARDPATDVVETPADLLEQGYRDAYRFFVEPVVGAEPPRPESVESEEGAQVEL